MPQLHKFSTRASCPDHPDFSMPPLEPRLFSFNSPHGACPSCSGLGEELVAEADLVVLNPKLSIAEGAIHPWADGSSGFQRSVLRALSEKYSFSLQTPWEKLPETVRSTILDGEAPGSPELKFRFAGGRFAGEFAGLWHGVLADLRKRYDETESEFVREKLEGYFRPRKCEKCAGTRLRPEALAVTVGGKNIVEVARMSVSAARDFFAKLGEARA